MIEEMLVEDGITPTELGRRCGLDPSTIAHIRNGVTKRVRVEPTLDRLCNYGDKLLYDFLDPC